MTDFMTELNINSKSINQSMIIIIILGKEEDGVWMLKYMAIKKKKKKKNFLFKNTQAFHPKKCIIGRYTIACIGDHQSVHR